ncbi:MAG: AAA family ATPase [Bacteroidia bacterium]
MNTDILAILQHLKEKDAIILFFDWLQKMIQVLDIKEDMNSFGFTPRTDKNKLKFSVNLNQRRVLCIEKIQQNLYFQVMVNEEDVKEIESKFAIYNKSENFTGRPPVAYLLHIDASDLTDENQQKLLFDKWITACKSYFLPTHDCTTRNKHNPELYAIATNQALQTKYLASTNPYQIILERYKNIIRETHLKQEVYKWENVQQFQGRPDTAAADFNQELRNIQFGNLIYQIAKGVMLHITREKPEDYRNALKKLFDENIPLSERVETFVKEVNTIFKTLNVDNPSHHDERTIATLLTYKFPDKYAFYKDSFYQKYCKLLNLSVEKKNKKYVHYLNLLKDFKENYLQKDAELLALVQSYLPENSYSDTSLNLLAQDILYQVLDRELDVVNYWVFQCNPKQFDIETALRENIVSNWNVSTHKEKIKMGDKVILWVTGEKSGCYALAEITDEIKPRNAKEKDAHLWTEEQKNGMSVAIKITHNWVENPVYKEQIKDIPDLANFKGGTQGTNLASTEAEYLAFLDIFSSFPISQQSTQPINMDKNIQHPHNQILYGPPGTGKTYHTINEALAIIEGKSMESLENEDRKELTKRYKTYVDAGQIMFTTFHQSMSYEDFIEGIKPETGDNGQVIYNVKDGIFKLICEKAYTTKNAPNFEAVYQQFVNDTFETPFELKTQSRQVPFDVEVSQKGDCYSITRGEKKTRTGYSKSVIQSYLINGAKLPYPDSYFYSICDYIKNSYPFEVIDTEAKPHILIIDEINRGNVSQIFGELITLIEDSKRKGESEELEITLPYSKRKFSVPNNLYLIGTMNTADRSVEALDTALRRRFIFKEMSPKSDLLKECAGVDLQALLTKINERLAALLSKDHTIGHAYFINCRTQKELETVFYQKIIPLLQEYFYGDLSKIQWIIGADFVKVEEVNTNIFMGNKENLYHLPQKVTFKTDLKDEAFLDAIKKVYQ